MVCELCSLLAIFGTGGIPERFVLKVDFFLKKNQQATKKETQITRDAKTKKINYEISTKLV